MMISFSKELTKSRRFQRILYTASHRDLTCELVRIVVKFRNFFFNKYLLLIRMNVFFVFLKIVHSNQNYTIFYAFSIKENRYPKIYLNWTFNVNLYLMTDLINKLTLKDQFK
jgi:hypothetical protein